MSGASPGIFIHWGTVRGPRSGRAAPKPRARGEAVSIPSRNWQVHSVGKGAKGLREYAWGWLDLAVGEEATGHHYLLVRQNLSTGEQAFYRCWSPGPKSLHDLVAPRCLGRCAEKTRATW